ncbi:MAG: copper chaperone PCu(A)C [Mycobacterium sp.]
MLKNACVAALLMGALALAGCSSEPQEPAPAAETVDVGDAWVKGADTGMTSAFGRLVNTGSTEVRMVSATSPAAGSVELHEVASDGGAMVMRQKDGGFVLPAASEVELGPGGDHFMLMDITEPLLPGDNITIVATFDDGSTLPITAQVRDFPGADEQYDPSAHG